MQYLRQSTASQSVVIGPFVDSTDGDTAETALSIANTDIRLSANGGNIVAKNSGGATHDELGFYTITLDATDTATVGRLQLICKMAGALVVYHEYQVVEESTYDFLYASGADPDGQIAALATASALATAQADLDTITGSDGVTLATTQGNYAPAKAGDNMGTVSAVTGGINTGAGTITTLDALDTAQDTQHGTTQTAISNLNDPTAAAIADAVWDEATSGHTTPGSTAVALTDTLADTNELQTNQGDWATATGFSTHSAADVRTEMDSNSTQLAKLGTPATDVSADIAAVKTVVDALPAATDIVSGGAITTSGGIASADVKKINGATVIGDGNATPWDGA